MSKKNDDAARQAVSDGAQTARQVAAITGMTSRQAQEAIHHLEATGQIEADSKTGAGNTASTTYKPTGNG